jgi:hypothetical protein
MQSPSTGDLVARISMEVSRLARDEIRHAQLEVAEKGKKVGQSAGLFGTGGVIALYGVGCLIGAAIIGLAHAVPAWLAALIIGMALLLSAGVAALMGRKQVKQAVPPAPTETMQSIRTDVATVKENVRR